MKNKTTKFLISIFLAFLTICAVIFAIFYAVSQQEVVYCYKIQKQFVDNYSAYKVWIEENPDQATMEFNMCEEHNINVYEGTV